MTPKRVAWTGGGDPVGLLDADGRDLPLKRSQQRDALLVAQSGGARPVETRPRDVAGEDDLRGQESASPVAPRQGPPIGQVLTDPLSVAVQEIVHVLEAHRQGKTLSTPGRTAPLGQASVQQETLPIGEFDRPRLGRVIPVFARHVTGSCRPPRPAPQGSPVTTGQADGRSGDLCQAVVLRVAWTMADLAGRTVPGADDVAEALGMRLQRVEA